MIHIVLVHAEIPGNTGNIGRTCVALGAKLHLVRPLGFTLDEKHLLRAGLDYWQHLDFTLHDSLTEFEAALLVDKTPYLFSRFAQTSFWDVKYPEETVLIFGNETKGLPSVLKEKYQSTLVKIPTPGNVRSLNLSVAVGVAAFEVARQRQKKHKR